MAPRERLGYALGLLGTGQTVGNVFGPLLGGLISSGFGYRVAFLSPELAARPSLLRGMAVMARSRDLVAMFVVLALSRLTIGGLGPVTSLYVGELGVAAGVRGVGGSDPSQAQEAPRAGAEV